MAARKQTPGGASASPTVTVYEGQKTEGELRALINGRQDDYQARRSAWLADHEDWLPCGVSGCSGLVKPFYIRTSPSGEKYGLCPRRSSHSRLMPNLFAIAARALPR